MGDLLGKVLGFIENKSTRLAVAAVIIATLLIGCALIIVGGVTQSAEGWQFAAPAEFRIAFVLAYFVLFVGTWFILYLQNAKDASDVYSEVREKLIGQWVISYDADIGPISNQIVVPRRAVGCFISVNAEQKLELVFRIRDNPIFKDEEKQVVKDVAIRYNDTGGYTMFYYYQDHRELQPQITEYLVAEHDQGRVNEVEVEVFGHVSFEKSQSAGGIVQKMEGHWFDLNGNISRLFTLLDQKSVANIRKEQFTPMRLSQVPVHQRHFNADMGKVEFSRMA
jgi:hypothetical protein